MDRRTFVMGAAAIAAGCTRSGGSNSGPKAAKPLGVQLYTVRDLMAEDVAATLDLVASAGFREVEFAGYFDYTPAEMRKMLDASGLAAPSTHIGKDQFVEDAASVIDHAAAMGHRYVVVSSVGDEERSLDDFRRHAADFNRWAEACAAAGLTFAYHNHRYEFEETDGGIPYDLLLAETDPELVKLEMDLAWAYGGGADILAYFSAWPSRFPLVHLKDFRDGEEVDIGTGDVPFDAILAHAKLAGIEHGFVERDHPTDPAAALRLNHDAIVPAWDRFLA